MTFTLRSKVVLLGVLSVLLPGRVHAEPPLAPAPNACEPVEKTLAEVQSRLQAVIGERDALGERAREVDELRMLVDRLERELDAARSSGALCQADRAELCSSTGGFARSIETGQLSAGPAAECIDPDVRRALGQRLSGWSDVTRVLGGLAAYSAGESDVVPRLSAPSDTRVEQLLLRVLGSGNGEPLVYRRLLIEALQLLAPRTFRAIEARPGAVDRWFASQEPLDEEFVVEASSARDPSLDAVDTPLSTALDLVTAYEVVGRCTSANPARDCRRAAQLRTLVNVSGPLVLRRRVEDVWATDCAAITSSVVSGWLRRLPRSATKAKDPSTDPADRADGDAVLSAVRAKLGTCFLREPSAGDSFASWARSVLPDVENLSVGTADSLRQLDAFPPGSPGEDCVRAVRGLQNLAPPDTCAVPEGVVERLETWSAARAGRAPSDGRSELEAEVCERYATALWSGEAVSVPSSFLAPPGVEEATRTVEGGPVTPFRRLRDLCAERVGRGESFVETVSRLGAIGARNGESPRRGPWSLEPTLGVPLEMARASHAGRASLWLGSFGDDDAACSLLELSPARCRSCGELSPEPRYDCEKLAEVEAMWRSRTRLSALGAVLALVTTLLLVFAFRMRSARVRHGAWLRTVSEHFAELGLVPEKTWLRLIRPLDWGRLWVALPGTSAWERWGREALVTRAEGDRVLERDVNRAGAWARERGATLALLTHSEGASPDLAAVRAILEWAARGSKAVQVLVVPESRVTWAQNALDLLELADEASLRSNPFELRGRVTSSSQFFDRERLVSGLLASAQAGQFCVVTGLRRFGKSSLALEVARRLPGPASYVDLAGFHHEIGFSADPGDAADAILRYLCLQFLESARARSGRALALEAPTGRVDAAVLSAWFRDFVRELSRDSREKTPPLLIILDEIEQAIGAATKLDAALDVLSILVGRLRNSLPGAGTLGHERIGVLFTSALHPLLWSPLATLAHQSIVGSFQVVSVPCLPREATRAMMNGLGARQGIRFNDDALELLVDESQGVPLLARRLGTAVLELYDPDRARQGALGAVQVGLEGVRAALEREESEGSASRVWIESEIAEPKSPGGAVLRALSVVEWLDRDKAREAAARAFREQFETTGVALALSKEEALRRAEEAAAVTVRILDDSGLLERRGDPTEPEAYALPEGIIRRVLSKTGAR